jgi:hypothetical protein
MPPLPIVEALEVVERLGARRRAGGPRRVVDQLDLERREEALRDGIVPAIAPPVHAADDPVLCQDLLVVAAGVLAPTIRMMHQALGWAPPRQRQAKTLALKRCIAGAEKGLEIGDLLAAVREEFKENEELPNTTNPDDWAKIAGKKGERISHVKSLVGQTNPGERPVEKVVNTGQYL